MDELKWFKSSYSGGAENCVEVGTAPGLRVVRDSKHGSGSPMLVFSAASWQTFASGAKHEEMQKSS